jgi:hypothetical protein
VHARKTAAFEELFLPHIDGAYNLARWIVERDRDAQTVVQEAYIQALNEFVEFRGADVRAWLLVIVRNAAYTWIQKRGINSGIIPFEEAIHVAPTDQPVSESSHEEQNRLVSHWKCARAVALSSKPFSRRLPIDMHPDKKRTRPLFSDRKEQENALVLFAFCNLRIFLSLGENKHKRHLLAYQFFVGKRPYSSSP